MSETRAVAGEHAELSSNWPASPVGRTVEVVSGPDTKGMVYVRYVGTLYVPADDLEFWGDAK